MNRRNWLASLMGIFAAKKATTTPYTLMDGTPVRLGKTATDTLWHQSQKCLSRGILTKRPKQAPASYRIPIELINPENIKADIR